MTDWLAFVGIMALGQFSPGPDFLLVTRTALAEGKRAGLLASLGIGCGLVIHASLAAGGLAVIPAGGRSQWIAWIGQAYLVYLGIRLLVSAWRGGGNEVGGSAGTGGKHWLRGFLCCALNPKALLFLSAALAPFLQNHPERAVPFAATAVFQGAALWCVWAVLLQWRPVKLLHARAVCWIDAVFGAALIALAAVWFFRG